MAITASVRGSAQLIAKFQNLAKKGAKACLRKSTRKGANVILAEVRSRAPVGKTGNYKRGLKLKPKTTGTIVSTWVRATAPHSTLIDLGSKDRYVKTGRFAGKYVGRMPALKVMKDAAASKGQQALDVATTDLAKQIETAALGDGSGGS